jgi:protein-S-isoprenylcysteine O-methyltransferase Ste14
MAASCNCTAVPGAPGRICEDQKANPAQQADRADSLRSQLIRWTLGGESCFVRYLDVHLKQEEMHLLDQGILGITILFLLGMLVIVKRVATGCILDRPKGNLKVQLVNIFNLFFLLVVNPVAAILLITRRLATIDPTHMTVDEPWILMVLEFAGLVMYVIGYLLMAWALITLGRNYQLGGSGPRSEDKMVIDGPYKLVRHPMYTAALSISLGLACLIQSGAFFCVFCIYLVLIFLLIPVEEDGLRRAYGEQYVAYRQKAKKLIPFVY